MNAGMSVLVRKCANHGGINSTLKYCTEILQELYW